MYIWRKIPNKNIIELGIKDCVGAYMKYACSLSLFAYGEV